MSVSLELIKNCGPLSELPADIQEDVSQQVKTVSIPANTTLFDYGSACVMLPLVLDGSVRVFKQSESGREISLYRVTKNQLCIVTLSCLLGGSNYPATGVTESAVSAIVIPDSLFHQLLAEHKSFRESVFQLFAERMSGLMQLINEVTFHKLDQRLAQLLLSKGSVIKESHQQVADELGSVREIVSRVLKQFEERNWIKLARKQIEVLDIKALEQFSSDAK